MANCPVSCAELGTAMPEGYRAGVEGILEHETREPSAR